MIALSESRLGCGTAISAQASEFFYDATRKISCSQNQVQAFID
jgi:hypothetical protein